MQPIILASSSPFRRKMLADAGVEFNAVAPALDERETEALLVEENAAPAEVALALALAKAKLVSGRHPDALVIGCDQILSLSGQILHKPVDEADASRRLLALSGRTHELHSAVALLRENNLLWSHVGVARMTMRTLDPAYISRHLARVGGQAITSVGAYQIEGEGIQLFERIEGDHFTIVGLPLFALLDALRAHGAIDG